MNPVNPREPNVMKGSFLKTGGRNGPERPGMNLMNLFSWCKERVRITPRGFIPKRFIRFMGSFSWASPHGTRTEFLLTVDTPLESRTQATPIQRQFTAMNRSDHRFRPLTPRGTADE